MLTLPRLSTLALRSLQISARHPIILIVLAFPELAADVAMEFVVQPSGNETSSLYLATLLVLTLVIVVLLTEWSYAAIFLWVEAGAARSRASWRFLSTALAQGRKWVPAVVCAVLLIFLGMPILLPALYFMAIFSFVTPSALRFSRAAPLKALGVSKDLISLQFWKLFPVVLGLVLLDLSLGLFAPDLLGRLFDDPTLVGVARGSAKILIVAFSIVTRVFLSLLFIELWRAREHKLSAHSGEGSRA